MTVAGEDRSSRYLSKTRARRNSSRAAHQVAVEMYLGAVCRYRAKGKYFTSKPYWSSSVNWSFLSNWEEKRLEAENRLSNPLLTSNGPSAAGMAGCSMGTVAKRDSALGRRRVMMTFLFKP